MNELVVGHTYVQRQQEAPGGPLITIIQPPAQDERGRWWVRVRYVPQVEVSREPVTTSLSLSDLGVVPYGPGGWNQLNWLDDPERVIPQEAPSSSSPNVA